MLESEAKTKWCPFARLAHHNAPTGGNRPVLDEVIMREGVFEACMCIASECMAWRATDKEYGAPVKGVSKSLPAGYCGLAGPQ